MQNGVVEVHLGDYQRSTTRTSCESMLIYGIMILLNAVGAPSSIWKGDNDLGDLNLYICRYWSKIVFWKSIWVTTSAVRPEQAVNPCSHMLLWPYGMQLGRHLAFGKATMTLATSIYTYADTDAKWCCGSPSGWLPAQYDQNKLWIHAHIRYYDPIECSWGAI